MLRKQTGFALTLALCAVACSAKAPPTTSGDSPRSMPEPPPLAAPTGTTMASAPADPREAALSAAVVHLMEKEHLLRKKIDDQISREAFNTYIKRLDATKMFLLKSDRDALAVHADKIDDELHNGSLDLAHDGAKVFAARVAVVEKMVAELLDKPFNLNDEEWIELDGDKVELAANDQELRERWRRRLELEVLEKTAQMEARLKPPAPKVDPNAKPGNNGAKKNGKPQPPVQPPRDDDDDDKAAMPASQIPPTPEGREAKARADLAKSYAGRFARLKTPGSLDAAAEVVNAVAATLDPHSTYLPPADKANFDIHMTGSLEGIGAVLRERDHYVEVVELVAGGAAWRQGNLGQGDLILSVAQNDGADAVDTADMKIDDVVKMIRGPKGTTVRLRVLKPAGNEETIAITRDKIVIEETYARGAILQRPGQPAYGYIHLPSFYGGKGPGQRTASDDIKRLLLEMKQRKVPGVIIDLRSNGGGILGDAVEMTGHLIDRGPVVQVQDSQGQRETLSDPKPGFIYDGNVVVLVDQFSASASEIVAGALQDYNRAVIVGTGPTHGKGTVQTLADLDRATGGKIELGSFKITIQQFFRVTGASTQREGVKPDIVLPNPFGYVDSGERELEHSLPWSQIDPVPFAKWPASWNKTVLAQKSLARVAKQPALSKIAAAVEVLRARKNDTRVPLQRAAWDARRKEQKAALDAASPDYKAIPTKTTVKVIEDPSAAPPPPPPPAAPSDKTKKSLPQDPLAKWRENLAHDPWVEESLNVLGDMK
ncbi:MAG TPA: carboxy terminal-processing peptidase [Kofleriaceae bacterium]|nr:carboxy terminal-processing peptidase [Kofleriaceae bacterium]